VARVTVSHRPYGCDTGCCGHVVQVDDEEAFDSFQFDHPYFTGPEEHRDRAYREFAEQLVREELGEEHVKDLDWENCYIVDS
jgi:hypothetical protein